MRNFVTLNPKLLIFLVVFCILLTALDLFVLNSIVMVTYPLNESKAMGSMTRQNVSKDQWREVFIQRCNCSKLLPYPALSDPKIKMPNTTCAQASFSRGPNQKVVSFSFYEDHGENPNKAGRNYFQGILANLEGIKRHYPGYIMRLYYQIDDDDSPVLKSICQLTCHDPYLDICDANHNPMLKNMSVLYPLLWRFLPAVDAQVELFLSRDLDSRIENREVAAVKEFLQSDKEIHVMRDHPAHNTYLMGGLWGAKTKNIRPKFHMSFKDMFKDTFAYANRHKGGFDQLVLTHYIWKWAKKRALQHDSYLCHKYSPTVPFPTKREDKVGNYVGSIYSLDAKIPLAKQFECPLKCRPKEHKDWTYC